MNSCNKCTTLVVDDEPAITSLLACILRGAGMEVICAGSGDEAFEAIVNHRIDVVLTDINMEGMSGFDLLELIQKTDDSIKVIMMTGYDSYDNVTRALKANAYDYLKKPLTEHDEVVNTVKRAYENSCLIRENSELVDRLRVGAIHAETANQQLTELNEQLRQLANTDDITQLYNRRYIESWMQNHHFSTSFEHSNYSLLLVEPDHFSSIKDRFGHDSGDQVLRHLASILKNATRKDDVLGRYYGEVFIVLMPDVDEADATAAAGQIIDMIGRASINVSSGTVKLTASIGISTSSQLLVDSSSEVNSTDAIFSGRLLLSQANKALDNAKQNGQNECVHFNELNSPHSNAA